MTSIKYIVKSTGKLYMLNPTKDDATIQKDLQNVERISGIKCTFNRKFKIKHDVFDKKVLCYEYDMRYNDEEFKIDYSVSSPMMKAFSVFCTELSKRFYELL